MKLFAMTSQENSRARTSFWSEALRAAYGMASWENLVIAGLLVVLPMLTFYNLGVNPRPWHDEGSTLSLARTLAEDGVYAVRSSDGYQTFGAVQSVGPTIILPVALVYQWFGVGLLQGRAVAGIYLLLTLLVFFLAANELFGKRVAILSILFLISAPAVRLFLYGRQVLGEVPALGFFLAGWLIWARACRSGRWWQGAFAGLFMGAAVVTKSQYMPMALATLGLICLLDIFYYRLGTAKITFAAGSVAVLCIGAWYAWQFVYFGKETFLENASKLGQLAQVTTGLNLSVALHGLRSVFGSDTGNFYIFWGVFALAYFLFYSARKDLHRQTSAFLLLFTGLWLAYYVLWTIPWQRYALPAMAITIFFISKLYALLASAFTSAWSSFKPEIRLFMMQRQAAISSGWLLSLGTLFALASFGLWMGYQFEKNIRADVIDKQGDVSVDIYTPQQLWAPAQAVSYLNQTIDRASVVETWERELGILTEHNYHYPDQSYLAAVDAYLYRHGTSNYKLGDAYFNQIHAAYVVVGFYARFNQIYDMRYINAHYTLVKSIGSNNWQYDIYQLK